MNENGKNLPAKRPPPLELVPATKDGELWERLKGESRPAFSNFACYRDMGPERSMRKTAAEIPRDLATLANQAYKYSWQVRIDAYEDYLDKRRREKLESERERVNRAGMALFEQTQLIAGRRLLGAPARDGKPAVTALDANDLDAADVMRMIEVSWRGMRTATGQPTDVIKGFFNITSDDLLRITQGVIEICERILPDERRGRFLSEVQAFIERGGQW